MWCFTLKSGEQAVVTGCTDKYLVDGPTICTPYFCCWESVETVQMIQLDPKEMLEVRNYSDPEKSTWKRGPQLVKLESAWESFQNKRTCISLDQDDYLIVRGVNGKKDVIQGPKLYIPREYGEEVEKQAQSVQVPVNHYIVVNDADNTIEPIQHFPGPLKWYPKPFQTLTTNTKTNKDYWPMFEVNTKKAIHLQRANGIVDLLDQPTFYVPKVGEKVLKYVDRQVLLTNDFCILKSPDGTVHTKNGLRPADRAFFLAPFQEFLFFDVDDAKTGEITKEKILSTLPKNMQHTFDVRTTDNVILALDMRITYRIDSVDVFSANPIPFSSYIKNHVQNALLDKFAQSTLREFMNTFSKIAQSAIAPTNEWFMTFGIEIIDLQILHHECTNTATQKLLNTDIHTNVTKQNELKARQNDVLIQEESNKIKVKQKDLEVQMSIKDNEVSMEQKLLENSLRIKEMDIEIQEELKRTDLLEVRRGNDLVEAIFEGRAKGHEFREYLAGIDGKLTHEQKIQVWKRKCDLEQSDILYAKVNQMSIYPANVDMKTFIVGDSTSAASVKRGFIESVGREQGLQ